MVIWTADTTINASLQGIVCPSPCNNFRRREVPRRVGLGDPVALPIQRIELPVHRGFCTQN
jgi:hypothetical protein